MKRDQICKCGHLKSEHFNISRWDGYDDRCKWDGCNCNSYTAAHPTGEAGAESLPMGHTLVDGREQYAKGTTKAIGGYPERVSSPPAVNYLREVLPRPDDPSCHVCGAMMTPSEYKCASCETTTGVSSPRSAEAVRKSVCGIDHPHTIHCGCVPNLEDVVRKHFPSRWFGNGTVEELHPMFPAAMKVAQDVARSALPGQPSPAPEPHKK